MRLPWSQHSLWKYGVRVLGRREEPDIGKLCPWKRTSGTSCDWEGWIHGSKCLLDLSWQTSPQTCSETRPVWQWAFWTSDTWLSGSKAADLKSDAIPHPSLEQWSTGYRTSLSRGGTTLMASFLKRVFTSCFNTRACSGLTNVRKTLWKAAAECRTECNSLFLHSEGPTEIHLAVVSTLLNNLLREPDSLDWLLVCLEQLAARETLNGVARLSAPLRSRAEKKLRDTIAWVRCTLEHWQRWQNDLLRTLRRDGHCVMWCNCSSPIGAALSSPGLKNVRTAS